MLVPGNPDIHYGARPEQLDRQVRNELNDLLVPSTQHDLPILPNFSFAAKGPVGSLAVAGRQACYDGALGAHSIHALQEYAEDGEAQDGNTYTITLTYHGGTLKMYTIYCVQSKEFKGHLEYVMSQVKGWSMTSGRETFERVAAYKDLKDWAKEKGEEAIDRANSRVRTIIDIPASNTSSISIASSFTTQEETPATNTQNETLRSFIKKTLIPHTIPNRPKLSR